MTFDPNRGTMVFMSNEYIIEVQQQGEVTHFILVERSGSISRLTANPSGFMYCTKFKNKTRAEKVAMTIVGARVVPSFGGIVYSSKSSVSPKKADRIRRN